MASQYGGRRCHRKEEEEEEEKACCFCATSFKTVVSACCWDRCRTAAARWACEYGAARAAAAGVNIGVRNDVDVMINLLKGLASRFPPLRCVQFVTGQDLQGT